VRSSPSRNNHSKLIRTLKRQCSGLKFYSVSLRVPRCSGGDDVMHNVLMPVVALQHADVIGILFCTVMSTIVVITVVLSLHVCTNVNVMYVA